MDGKDYPLESECQKFFVNVDSVENPSPEIFSAPENGKQLNNAQTCEMSNEVAEAIKSIENDEVKYNSSLCPSDVQKNMPPIETIDCKQVKIQPTKNERERGRVSVVRLQAVRPSSVQEDTKNTESSMIPVSSQTTSVIPVGKSETVVSADSTDNSYPKGCPSAEPTITTLDVKYSLPSEEIHESHFLTSSSSFSELSSTGEMGSYLTADGHYVYGYKNASGALKLFCPNDRENHNEKERKRRSRVTVACSSLRKLVPGLNSKTDKATVFEQAAKYLKFLKEKYGMQYNNICQTYCEKYFQTNK